MNLQNTEPVQQSSDIDTVKSNVVDLITNIRGIHINTDGVVIGILVGDTTQRSFTVKAGMYYPYAFRRIFSTGTTSTGAIGLI